MCGKGLPQNSKHYSHEQRRLDSGGWTDVPGHTGHRYLLDLAAPELVLCLAYHSIIRYNGLVAAQTDSLVIIERD